MVPVGRVLVLVGVLALPLAARAQRGAPDPAAAAKDARQAQEEVTLARIFARIRLQPAQAAQLAPALQQVQARLAELERQKQAAVGQLKAGAEETKRQAAAGQAPPTATEQKYLSVLRDHGAREQKGRADQVTALRGLLSRLLSRDQWDELVKAAQDTSVSDLRDQAYAQYLSTGRGPLAPAAGQLDRIRKMPEALFSRIQGGAAGEGLRGDAAINRRLSPEELMAGFGFGGPGGVGRGGPEAAAQRAKFAELAARVRNMTPEEYEGNKPALSWQIWQMGIGRREIDRLTGDAALDAFLDRHLLDPAAPPAARRRAEGGQG